MTDNIDRDSEIEPAINDDIIVYGGYRINYNEYGAPVNPHGGTIADYSAGKLKA